MKPHRRMNLTLTLPAPLANKIRACAAELSTSQSAVIDNALRSFLASRQLDDIEGSLAKAQYDLDVLLEAFELMAGPRFFELMDKAARRVDGLDEIRRPDRDN
jgi:hypothetical protein